MFANSSTAKIGSQPNAAVNREHLSHLLTKAFAQKNTAAGKDIVLVIGSSGAGKSTNINYLLASPMAEETDETGLAIITVRDGGREYAKIGHSISISQTLYTELFPIQDYYLCDCPGFADTRSLECIISAAVSTKVTLSSARNIKSILVVIEQESLYTERSKGLRDVFQTLRALLTPSDDRQESPIAVQELKNSIQFLITKSTSHIKLVGLIQKIKSERSNDATEESKNIVFMCDLMLSDPDNLIKINPLDNNESRTRILNRISAAKPLLPRYFGFPLEEPTKRGLKDLLDEIAIQGTEIITLLTTHPRAIKNKEKDLNTQLARMEELDKLINELNSASASSNERTIKEIKKLIRRNEKRLQVKIQEKNAAKNKQDKLEAEFGDLNNPEEVIYCHQVWDERKIFGIEKNARRTILLHYNGQPFERSVYTCSGEGSEFGIPESDPANGRFEITYTPGADAYGSASFIIYGKKNQLEENVMQMALTRKAIALGSEKLAELAQAIANTEAMILNLETKFAANVKENDEEADTSRRLLLAAYAKEKADCLAAWQKSTIELTKLKEMLDDATKQFPLRIPAFELVIKLAPLTSSLGSTTVRDFLNLYNAYSQPAKVSSEGFFSELTKAPLDSFDPAFKSAPNSPR